LKTRILKVLLVCISFCLTFNISKAQQYITSSTSSASYVGYACYNYFDNNTAANIAPTPVGSTTNSIVMSAALANTLSATSSTGRCLQSNYLSTPTAAQAAAINYIPGATDKTTYAADLNTNDWEWSLIYKSTLATGTYPSTPSTTATNGLVAGSNSWRYWLHASTTSITSSTSGFYLTQNSTGYLEVYVVKNGTAFLLITGDTPLSNNTPYCIKIQRNVDGYWKMYVDPYSSTLTQAKTLQISAGARTNASDKQNISLAYKTSFLEAENSSAATNGTFNWDEMHMYTRYLKFTGITSPANGITPSPLYAGEGTVILYGMKIETRGNYEMGSQIYVQSAGSGAQGNFTGKASLYRTSNPVFSTTGLTPLMNNTLDLFNGTTQSNSGYSDTFVSSGDIDGSLTPLGYYFLTATLQTSAASVNNSGTLKYNGFSTASSIYEIKYPGNTSAVTFTNVTNSPNTITFGAVYDWKGGSFLSFNSWTTGGNWVGGSAPGNTDIARIGVVAYTATNPPYLPGNTTIGQVIIGPNSGNGVEIHLNDFIGLVAYNLTSTNGITVNANSNLSIFGVTTILTTTVSALNLGGTSNIASTASITANTATVANTGNFTLLSDASGTANIGTLTNASFTGTYNVQRYLTAVRNWRLLSSPINDSGQIPLSGTIANNKYDFLNLTQNLIVTGTGGSANGFDPPASWNAFSYAANGPTVLFYDETKAPSARLDFTALTAVSASTTKTVGTGFYFYYRGDRTNNLVNKIVRNSSGSFATPESTQGLWTGSLNQGPLTYTLSYTNNAGATDNGFNLIGNPYPCTIYVGSVNGSAGVAKTGGIPTVWEFDFANNSCYPAGTGNAKNYIASGQGFFVKATSAGASMAFTESSKYITSTNQPTGPSLLMSTPSTHVQITQDKSFALAQPNSVPAENEAAVIQLEMRLDSANADFTSIRLASNFSSDFNESEDIDDLTGNGQKVFFGSLTADGRLVAANATPLLKQKTSVYLSASGSTAGLYTIKKLSVTGIPNIYDVWLMDHFKKDSININDNKQYNFNIDYNPDSYGNKRFELVIKRKLLPPYKLLSFTGKKINTGNQINWKTASENNYTTFQLQKSTANDTTFRTISRLQSDSSGNYTFIDKSPAVGTDNMYRLIQTDINDVVTYSNIVIIPTGTGSAITFSVYPNPTSSSINFTLKSGVKSSIKSNIYNSMGSLMKSATFNDTKGQQDVSGLVSGTYIIEIIDNNTKQSLGQAKFIKS
jgi:hypothetical protein